MNPVNVRDEEIFRAGLVQKMKTLSARKHLFITASGGYGKTVAARQWVSHTRKKAETMTVTDADNDPGVFYRRLTRALLLLTEKTKPLPQANVSFDRLLETVRSLPTRPGRVVLLIDDLHMLTGEEIVRNLPLIAGHLPAYICLCLISRSEPSGALLDTGRFEVLTQDDLLFTSKEIKSLCGEKDRGVTPEEADSLLKATGGWAIYLSLLLSGKEYGQMPQTLTEYLEKRVWALWGQDTKTSLLRLAVPHEVTPELARRLTGQADGAALLTRLAKVENAFLSYAGGAYRFHDIFRDFLLERLDQNLGGDEIRRLNAVTAEWHYQRGDYFNSMRYFFKNRDHGGIIRCERAITVYNEETENVSIEASYHFTSQNVLYMPVSFITENPFLIVECCCAALWGGDMPDFIHWKDIVDEKLPEIAEQYPDILETAGFLGSLDPRVPMLEYAKHLAGLMASMEARETDTAVTNTITHNLPFFHRSMRDLSEVYELKEDDLNLLKNTFGVMIGADYHIMEQSLIAGMYYERGDLLQAARHALRGYFACTGDTHSETLFSAGMILSGVLYAMGASREADRVMEEAEAYIERKAQFLHPNFKALQTIYTGGGEAAAREWLEVYACRTEQLPFYQMARHFATLRSHMVLGGYGAAAAFGKRLQALAAEYARPLDRIESGLLTAIALWHDGQTEEAAAQLEQAALIAMPYGFTQLFVNEGDTLLPLFWALREKPGHSAKFARWLDQLTGEIYRKHGAAGGKPPDLSARQRAMLRYLNQGLSYREIADASGLEVDTVKTHVRLLYKRLGVHNAAEAVIKAKMLGL